MERSFYKRRVKMAEERCYFCRTGTLERKRTTMTLHRGDRVIIIENVPAKVCDSCGEVIFAAEAVGGSP